MPATQDERIVDESYEAVFILGKEQIASHVCSQDSNKPGMKNMRVRLEDGKIITESTDGKILIKVVEAENRWPITSYPFDVNPSESPKTVLKEPKLVPGELLDELNSGFPLRRNYQKELWQRSAVFSFQDDKIEVGRSDKQGRPTVDSYDAASSTAFPPVDSIYEKLTKDETLSISFSLPLLKRIIEAMEAANTEFVRAKLWDSKSAMLLESVTKYGAKTEREISALIMPVCESA